ncbi:hypothetical protein AAFF_G00091710 [Aldrovandia affinis]|uniref:Spindle and centriole-associated protein 1 n=1 Tax=Aldrovandia affinis TaxID=143900 RepID=A0AAD7WY00_9TELE|nr:hypothetical protein AAFF_G00091710 [Aldrovandia affinis]
MSLTKVNRSTRGLGRRPTRSRKVTAPKQEWVNTIHDLNVHKATPEELKRRHELHRSQNRAAAQWELRERTLKHRMKNTFPLSPAQLDPAHLNIIRQVLSDQYQLQDVLARSDRALAVVKDLFGDAPHRQTGFPNVTVAPDSGPDPELPVLLRPEPPTQLSLLSQSVMDPQALNELEDVNGEEYSEEEDPSSSIPLHSNVDMSRFGRLLQDAAQSHGLRQHLPPPSSPQNQSAPEHQAALNATVTVRRVQSRQSRCGGDPMPTPVGQVLNAAAAADGPARKGGLSNTSRRRYKEAPGHDSSSLSGNQSSLNLLQCMLGELETELDSLEYPEPLCGSSTTAAQHSPTGLTGFSVSLLCTVSRLARCLRQTGEDVRREMQERKKLEEEVMEQRCLIDALTAETLTLRELSISLQDQLQQSAWHTEQQLETLKHGQRSKAHSGPSDSTAPYCVESGAGSHHAERKLQEQAPPPPAQRARPAPSPAVLLSPPRQRDSLPPQLHAAAERGLSLQQQAAGSRGRCGGAGGPQDPSPDTAPDTEAPCREPTAQFQEKAPPTGPCVEQHLQELSRQSAAARRRLLKLIEQQTQASVNTVSPAISPIPPTTSPPIVPADKRRTLTEQSSSSLTSSSLRSEAPLSGAVGANRTPIDQMDRLKEEGWFALSTHVQ